MPHGLTGWLGTGNRIELAWFVFAVLNLAAMGFIVTMGGPPGWETVPFHFVYVSFTILYGFRMWRTSRTVGAILFVAASTGLMTLVAIEAGREGWPEETEVPLMSLMFLAVVFHVRRRQQAIAVAEGLARQRADDLERQQTFLSDVSHELMTPITIARGSLDVLRRSADWTREEAEESLDIASGELCRMTRLLERLLLLERSAVPEQLHMVSTDLAALVSEVHARWVHGVEPNLELIIGAGGTAALDHDQIVLAIDALLENAVQHTARGNRIELRCDVRGRRVVIEVADTGSGIPADDLPHLFDRFYRVDPARNRRHGGAGLGLAIVDAIARAHGGYASIRSEVGVGTTATLTFPNIAAETHEIAASPHRLDLHDATQPAS